MGDRLMGVEEVLVPIWVGRMRGERQEGLGVMLNTEAAPSEPLDRIGSPPDLSP